MAAILVYVVAAMYRGDGDNGRRCWFAGREAHQAATPDSRTVDAAAIGFHFFLFPTIGTHFSAHSHQFSYKASQYRRARHQALVISICGLSKMVYHDLNVSLPASLFANPSGPSSSGSSQAVGANGGGKKNKKNKQGNQQQQPSTAAAAAGGSSAGDDPLNRLTKAQRDELEARVKDLRDCE
jgi:hypothetical protein